MTDEAIEAQRPETDQVIATLACATGDHWRLVISPGEPRRVLVQRAWSRDVALCRDQPSLTIYWATKGESTADEADLAGYGVSREDLLVNALPARVVNSMRVSAPVAEDRLRMEMRIRGAVPVDAPSAPPVPSTGTPPDAATATAPAVAPRFSGFRRASLRHAALDLLAQACHERDLESPVQVVRVEAAIDAVVEAGAAGDAARLRQVIADQAAQVAELRGRLHRAEEVVRAVRVFAGFPAHRFPPSVAAAYRAYEAETAQSAAANSRKTLVRDLVAEILARTETLAGSLDEQLPSEAQDLVRCWLVSLRDLLRERARSPSEE